MLTKLKSLHEDILRLIGELEALTKDALPRLNAVADARLRLTRASRQRTTLLEGAIYPRLLETTSGEDRARIVALRQASKEALMGSVNHIGRWTIAEIERNWADYRHASKAMRAAMRARIEAERATVYPLMAGRTDLAI